MRSPAVVTPGADLAPRAPALPRPVIGALFVAGVVAAALSIPALVAGGMGLALDGRVMPRVSVAGVDVGFRTAAEAEAALRVELADLTTGELAITLDGTATKVAFASLGRDHDYSALVSAAMAVGRSGNPWADGQVRLTTLVLGTQVADAVSLDPARFDRLVVDTAARAFTRPQDAAVITNPDGTYAVVPPSAGRRLHPDNIRAALSAALLVPQPGDAAVELRTEAVPFEVTQRQAAEAAAAARAMQATSLQLTNGGDAYTIAAYTIAAAIGFGIEGDEPYGVILNRGTLGAALDALAPSIQRQPTNAGFAFNSAGPSGVIPAVRGRVLNVAGTVDAIVAGLYRRGAGITVPGVVLSASFVEPTLTTADAQAILPNLIRLSTWTTYYVPGPGNGANANIHIPALDLDGMVILPGENFDFWRDIGPVTVERGYTYGGAIIGGRSTGGVALAGGICSTSTTMFNTALRAGLQMDSRMNHYYYIDRYPMGLDATVFATDYFSQTMSFTNDTGGPLIIRSFTGHGMVRFDLWGLPTNRVVSFTNPVITNRTYAVETVEYTSSLPAGTSQRVEYMHHGFDVTVTRIVTDTTTGQRIHEDTYFSSYKTVNGVTLVGTG
ncbi:MAG: VanW family protein [Candidatus Limnocylindria bacterium]